MSISTATRRFSLLGTLAAAAIGLAAFATPLNPAKAQVYFGFGPFGFGVGAPSYYYPPAAYPYYYPSYYGSYGTSYYYPGYYYPNYYYPW